MANTDINSLSEISSVVAADDELAIQQSGDSVFKKTPISKLVGGWRDLRAALIGAKAAGVSDPTLAIFAPSGGIKQYKFAVGNEVFLAFHIDHDIKAGSTVYPHVHWATDGTETNTVKWEMEYTIAARTDEPSFPAPTTIDVTAAAKGTAWAHQVTEHGVGFTAPDIDSLIILHLTRVTNGGTENTDGVFGLFVDLHYEAQQYGTVNRAAPFNG